MNAPDEPRSERDGQQDDLVERARELAKRAEQLEEEEVEVEELEQGPKQWLEREPKHYWPPEGDEPDDAA
jgi:hypothetical protein